ncbi:hypothetical protein QTH02_14190 [Clostridium perfringens]|nr:hypothetical protein [Clostridium perfringens]
MIVRSNNFQIGSNKNDRVFYSIDERLTDGVKKLNFFTFNSVKRFNKRKLSYEYDVSFSEIEVTPAIQDRTVEDFEKYIDIFYIENLPYNQQEGLSKIYKNNAKFSCDINRDKKCIYCDDYTRDFLEEKIFKSNFSEEELVNLLLSKVVSGYSR